jgi:hypothetical protein
VEWIHLAQVMGSCVYGDERSGSGATGFVRSLISELVRIPAELIWLRIQTCERY